ncbi:MAG: HDOD domain-containing protein [Deltaproteobacteria bacterium]|nr:HDOD domain-containing protein [Deltaproteobacteria bacterium]
MASKVEKIIARIEQIPTLPVVSQHIVRLLGEDDVPLKRVAEIIEKDQSLAVKILKAANSSFYGTLHKISSIDHALAMLGTEEVRAILLSSSVYRFFYRDSGDRFDRTRFWRHSVVCSQVAKYLARHFRMKGDDSLFLSGLIHDIGKVVLDQYFQEDFLKITARVSGDGETFTQVEKEILGTTHYQVAAKLLQQWGFPNKLVFQVFYHHAPWADRNDGVGSTLVYLADQLTKMAGYACLENEKYPDVGIFTESRAFDFLNNSGFDLDRGSVERLLGQIEQFIAMEGENMLRLFDESVN